jgi:hypothetical protein
MCIKDQSDRRQDLSADIFISHTEAVYLLGASKAS